MLAPVDFVGIYHNIALAGLAENSGKPHHAALSGGNDIPEHAPRPYGGKLIDVSHHHQAGSHRDCRQERMHQINIHHRHLIHNDHIRLQGILPVPSESAGSIRAAGHLQKPVDGPGLVTGGLRHPFGRPSRGSRQRYLKAFLLEVSNHRIDRSGFPCAGSSCQHGQAAPYSLQHRFPLLFIQDRTVFFLNPPDFFHHLFPVNLTGYIQVVKHLRRIQLQIIAGSRIDQNLFPLRPEDNLALHRHIPQPVIHIFRHNSQQLGGSGEQFFPGKINMALPGGLLQHIKNTASNTEIRIRLDPCPAGDLIRDPKTHSLQVVRHAVRIFPNHAVNLRPVFLINLYCQSRGDPVLLQEDHGLPHILLLLHLAGNLPGFPLADALDLRQPLRLPLYNPKGIRPEPAHDPGSQRAAHSLNGPGAQIPFHGHRVLRLFLLIGFNDKLISVGGMFRIMSPGLDQFSLSQKRKSPHTGNLLLTRHQVQHRVAVIAVPVNNMIHISFQHFHLPRPDPSTSLPPHFWERWSVPHRVPFPQPPLSWDPPRSRY